MVTGFLLNLLPFYYLRAGGIEMSCQEASLNLNIENFFTFSIHRQTAMAQRYKEREFTKPANELFTLARGDVGSRMQNAKKTSSHS